MLTCDFEATITALGVHEDIFEIVEVVEEMRAAFAQATFVGSENIRIHTLCTISNLICRDLVINRNAALHLAAMYPL